MALRVRAAPASSLHDRALRHHQHAVAEIGQLLGLGRDDEHRHAARRRVRGRADEFRARAPTSTPRVGSSRISTLRLGAQPAADHHLLLVAAAEPADRRLDARRLDREVADRRSAPALSRRRPLISGRQRLKTSESRLARLRLKATLFVSTSPSARRSSGTKPMPAFTAVGGLRGRNGLPVERHGAAVRRSAPNTSRATSLRPAPTRPPSPAPRLCADRS